MRLATKVEYILIQTSGVSPELSTGTLATLIIHSWIMSVM
jgi:hypothetical protein